jgi:hypothetical protein
MFPAKELFERKFAQLMVEKLTSLYTFRGSIYQFHATIGHQLLIKPIEL